MNLKTKTELHIYKNGELVAIQDITGLTDAEIENAIWLQQQQQGRTIKKVERSDEDEC